MTQPAEPREAGASTSARPWRRATLAALALWIAANVGHLLVNALFWRATNQWTPRTSQFLAPWLQWDAEHYLRIASEGYAEPNSPAFYPLYPLLVHVADPVLPQGALVAGLVVSSLATFGTLLMLYRLTDHEFGREIAGRAAFYLIAFPTAFFLVGAYNESLFIGLAIGCLYAARRGHWWLAGLLGALAGATRLFGLLLLAGLALEYLRQHEWRVRNIRPNVLSLALVPAGLGAFALFLWVKVGDPLAFISAQSNWGRSYNLPGVNIWVAIKSLDDQRPLHPATLGALVEICLPILSLALLVLAVVGPWRFRTDQLYLVAYAGTCLAVLLCTSVGYGRPLLSAPRLVMELFPIFIVLARMGANQFVDRIYLFAGISLQSVYLVAFLNGKWVA